MTQPGRILVVEDDVRTADVIALYLRHAGHRVWVEHDGEAALRRAREEAFDLLILDRMLPGLDGLAICRALTEERGVPVIMVTARTLEEDRIAGFEGGADDYVTKPFSPRELVARANALLRRAPPGARDQVRAGELAIDRERREARFRDAVLDLTPSEYEILLVLAERPGRVQSRATLLDAIPNRSRDALERTVDVHVRNLRRKLEAAGGAGDAIVETVFGAGYRLAPPDAPR